MAKKSASEKGIWKGFCVKAIDQNMKTKRISKHFHSRQAADDLCVLMKKDPEVQKEYREIYVTEE